MSEAMEKVITVSNAAINTATIEVKVIRIDKKQMTLAVFRQLKQEAIIHPDTGELCGIPWGRVNYHVGCEHQSLPAHLHIVWQKGNELRRSIAFLPWLVSWKPGNGYNPPQTFYSQFLSTRASRKIVIEDITMDIYDVAQSIQRFNWKQPSAPKIDREVWGWLERSGYLDLFLIIKPIQDRWQKSYSQLEQLDQLFIAV